MKLVKEWFDYIYDTQESHNLVVKKIDYDLLQEEKFISYDKDIFIEDGFLEDIVLEEEEVFDDFEVFS